MTFDTVLVGPGTLYVADFSSSLTFPDVDEDPSSAAWTELGEIDGGVTVTSSQTVDLHRVDSETGPVKATRSEEDLVVTASLAEATLENLHEVYNSNAITDTAAGAGTPGTRSMGLYRGIDVEERALLFRTEQSPYGDYASQFQVPRGVFMGEVGMAWTKDEKTMIPVEFTALVDTNQTANEKFGKVVMQDSAAS